MRRLFRLIANLSLFKRIGVICGIILLCGIGVYLWNYYSRNQRNLDGTAHLSIQVHCQSSCPTPTHSSPNNESSPSASGYIALGKVPVEGLQVGVTFYGALESPENGHYILSNIIQGGVKNGGAYNGYDDNGEGACEGKYANLTNQATWAEDDKGTILGDLPCGTKLQISYHGHIVVAEKGDTSNGGCTAPATRCSDNGHERMIDLWWQTAKALCFTDQPGIMTIHVVPADTLTTPIPSYDKNNIQATAVCE